MATDRLPALIIADDSAKAMRLEFDQVLHAVIHPTSDFLALPATDLRLLKAGGSDTRALEFRTGAIGAAGPGSVDGSTNKFYLKHNASDELEIYAHNGGSPAGIKISATGALTFSSAPTISGFPTILTASVTWDPGSIVSLDSATTTVTVTGASTSNSAVLVTPNASLLENIFIDGFVSASDTVTLRMSNQDSGSQNEPSHVYRVVVFQY